MSLVDSNKAVTGSTEQCSVEVTSGGGMLSYSFKD